MTPNSHQNLEMIALVKWLVINPMVFTATLADYKNQQFLIIFKLLPKTWYVPPKIACIKTMGLCDSWTGSHLQNWINTKKIDNKTLMALLSKPWYAPKQLQGVDPMYLCVLWAYSYLDNWITPPNLNHQTLMTLI